VVLAATPGVKTLQKPFSFPELKAAVDAFG